MGVAAFFIGVGKNAGEYSQCLTQRIDCVVTVVVHSPVLHRPSFTCFKQRWRCTADR